MKHKGNLYVVNKPRNQCAIGEGEQKQLLKRFGHININDLRKLHSDELVSGMKLNQYIKDFHCDVCFRGKSHQFPYKNSGSREKKRLGLIHSDICGPMKTTSIGGARYFTTFIGDSTRYTEVVMLKRRFDTLEAFKNYKQRVENETGLTIKKLRFDNGKEYTSGIFNDFLNGIKRQLSVEYILQQNVAEHNIAHY